MSGAQRTLGPWVCDDVVSIAATSRSQEKLIKKLVRAALGDETGEGVATDIHSITIQMSDDWAESGIFIGYLYGSDAGVELTDAER